MLSRQPTAAYVDGSALLSIIFEEPGSLDAARRLLSFDRMVSSTLLEAEICSAMARESWDYDSGLLSDIEWIYPNRPLTHEISVALRVRYLRSGDLLHLATALYAVHTRGMYLAFITLDRNQRAAADGLGFVT